MGPSTDVCGEPNLLAKEMSANYVLQHVVNGCWDMFQWSIHFFGSDYDRYHQFDQVVLLKDWCTEIHTIIINLEVCSAFSNSRNERK